MRDIPVAHRQEYSESLAALRGARVLVTGAGGFIGSHLTEALVNAGAEVTAFLHYNAAGATGHLDSMSEAQTSQLRIQHGDITDPENIGKAVRGHDIIFHLAALIAIPYSYDAPHSYLRANAEGTLNVMHAARAHEIERVVHISTSEVYGSAHYVPINEVHPLQGQSPYSASKIAADKLAESYFHSFELPVVTIRPFNTYGPRQSLRAMIPATIVQALWSDTIRLGALHPIRDMTYVEDTVLGIMLGATTPGIIGRTFNLGTGKGYSIEDIARMILKLTGRTDPIMRDDRRLRPENSEVDRLISDNTAYLNASGWFPRVSLEEGLERTIDFFKQRGKQRFEAGYIK